LTVPTGGQAKKKGEQKTGGVLGIAANIKKRNAGERKPMKEEKKNRRENRWFYESFKGSVSLRKKREPTQNQD